MTPDTPHVDDSDDPLGDILAMWLESIQAHHAPDPEAFLALHPEHAEELRHHLDNWSRFQPWVAPEESVNRLNSSDETLSLKLNLSRSLSDCRLGDYELMEELGRGGMGLVYRARHRTLGRVVALKVLRVDSRNHRDEMVRFRNESKIVARLHHPNLVSVYEVGEDAEMLYFTMRLIEGGPLSRELARFRDRPRDSARLVADTARAVHYVHQCGVLHRDLKPSNILLDCEGRPHVTDFGLAKSFDDDSGLTQSGACLGTPSYMAPEQASASRGVVTIATDVHGLGAVLYTLLSGQPPFQGVDLLQTLELVRSAEPAFPDRSKVDRDLQTICLKCLQKDPNRRYHSAEALAEDLEHWLDGKPIHARTIPTWERIRKWVWRKPALAALILLSVIASFSLIAGLYLHQRTLSTSLAVSDRLRQDGLVREAHLRRLLDVSDIRSARIAWENGENRIAREWLARQVPSEGNEDPRDFAWGLIEADCRAEPVLLGTHDSPILGMAVSPDERWLVTGDNRGIVKLWDLSTNRERQILYRSDRETTVFQFSPDGRTLAMGGMERMIRLWDVESWTEKRQLVGHSGTVRSLAFSPHGERLVTGLAGDTLKIWDLVNQKSPKTWFGHRGAVQKVLWTPNGKTLISTSNDRSVKLWDAETGAVLTTIPDIHRDSILAAALSNDGSMLVTSGYDRCVRLWDMKSRTSRVAYENPTSVRNLTFSPDDRYLAIAGDAGMLTILETSGSLDDFRFRRQLRHSEKNLRAIAFVDRGRSLLIAGEDSTVKRWAVNDLLGMRTIACPDLANAISVDGRWTVRVKKDGRISLMDAQNGTTVGELGRHEGAFELARFSPAGDLLATAATDGEVLIWDRVGLRERSRLERKTGRLDGISFSPTGELLVTASPDGSIHLWETGTGKLRATLKSGPGEPNNSIHCLEFSHDGRTLFTGGNHQDDRIHRWDIATATWAGELPVSSGKSSAMALSPDGRHLAVAGEGSVIRIWEIHSGREVGTLTGHASAVFSLAYSPDGRTLASSSHDKTVRLWQMPTMQELFKLTHSRSIPGSVAFSSDGRKLTALSGVSERAGEILTWNDGD